MNSTTNLPMENQIASLISDLGDKNGLTRQRARLALVHIGNKSVPSLLEVLRSQNAHVRWEAVRTLGELAQPDTATALTNMLLDEDTSVRWAAMESLIRLERASLRPLLESFIHNFDSIWMREGVHHILHVLKDRNHLKEPELLLFQKLDNKSAPNLNVTGEAAWAAEKALEALTDNAN